MSASRVLTWGARSLGALYQRSPVFGMRHLTNIHVDAGAEQEEVMDHFIDSVGAHAIAMFFAFIAFAISMMCIYLQPFVAHCAELESRISGAN